MAKVIWIAVHKDEPTNREVSLTEPSDKYTTLWNELAGNEVDYSAEWKEYLLIPIERDTPF